MLPPGPRVPSIVNALRYAHDPLRFFPRLRERHGDIFTVSFPDFRRVVYLAEPSLIRELFTGDPAQLHAGEANATVLEPAVGPRSVLTLDDDEHILQRKLLLPPFHGKAVERYREIIREAAQRDLATWPVGEPFGVRPRTQSITLEVILRAVYGLSDPARFARARSVTGEFAKRSDALLLPSFMKRGRRGPWGRFIRSRHALDALVYEEIALRRSHADGDGREDVLSLLMRAQHDDGSPLSDRELRDELVTIVGAGHETTATALAWAVERLVRHPEAMERLRADEDGTYNRSSATSTTPCLTGRRCTAAPCWRCRAGSRSAAGCRSTRARSSAATRSRGRRAAAWDASGRCASSTATPTARAAPRGVRSGGSGSCTRGARTRRGPRPGAQQPRACGCRTRCCRQAASAGGPRATRRSSRPSTCRRSAPTCASRSTPRPAPCAASRSCAGATSARTTSATSRS